jgi:hypothetical protein
MSGEAHCGHCAHHHELEVSGVTVRYRGHVALEDAGFATSCGNCVALRC